MLPLVETAQSVTGKSYRVGDYDDRDSFAMRVLAEHARSSTMLVSDGVFPSNEGRGYVLRRIIRRAVRYAYLLGTEQLVMPQLVETAINVMGNAYPDVVKNRDFILGVLTREEERFRHTLKTGLGDPRPGARRRRRRGTGLSGSTAFLLHDTYGFPLELTQEIAGERQIDVDLAGFQEEMTAQRRARQGGPQGQRRRRRSARRVPRSRRAVRRHRVRRLRRRHQRQSPAGGDPERRRRRRSSSCSSTARRSTPSRVARSATPARSSPTPGAAEVLDTTFALPNLRRHTARIVEGELIAGQTATAAIDVERRDAIAPQPHRNAPAALGAAARARRARQAGRVVRRPRSAAVRLLALRVGHRRTDRRDRAIGEHRDAAQRTRPRRTRPPRPKPKRWVRSPSSATSTATSSGCSKRDRRSSCAVARTSAPPATSGC